MFGPCLSFIKQREQKRIFCPKPARLKTGPAPGVKFVPIRLHRGNCWGIMVHIVCNVKRFRPLLPIKKETAARAAYGGEPMATYREFREQTRRRRRKRAARQVLAFVVALAIILGLAFLITKLIEGTGKPDSASQSGASGSMGDAAASETGISNSVLAPLPMQVDPGERSSLDHNSNRGQEVGYDAIVNSNPKRVYILMGANALVRDGEAVEQSYISYYSQLLDMLRQDLGSEVKIYVESVTPVRPGVSQPGLYKDRIQRVNNQLAALALEKGCYFVNIYEALADENGDLNSEYAAQDGVHLKPAAYPVMAEYLAKHTAYAADNPYMPGSPYYKG